MTETSASSNLMPCSDCGKLISRNAEACPQCGRFIQRFLTRATVEHSITVDRKGWAGTIAGGVILAFIIATVIWVGLVFLFWVLIFAGIAASMNQNFNR